MKLFPLEGESSSLEPSSEDTSFSSSSLPSSSSPSKPDPEPSPSANLPSEIRAIALTATSLTELDTLLSEIDDTVYNCVVLELKDRNGQIYYDTAVEHAAVCGAKRQDAYSAAAAAALIRSYGFYPLARMYALQDGTAAHALYQNAYCYQDSTDVSWLDNTYEAGGKAWLNPYRENAVHYLTAIVEEISSAGFVGVVVNGCQYPNTTVRYGMSFGETGGISEADAIENLLLTLKETAAKEGSTVIPAYRGITYAEGANTHIYGTSPNAFSLSPSAPIIENDLSVLNDVLAPADSLIPNLSSETGISSLKDYGIHQYIVG